MGGVVAGVGIGAERGAPSAAEFDHGGGVVGGGGVGGLPHRPQRASISVSSTARSSPKRTWPDGAIVQAVPDTERQLLADLLRKLQVGLPPLG
jgi:hypothetical protein